MNRATVTGADGFVGQWLLRRLLEQGYHVTGLIRATQPTLTTLDARAAQNITWLPFDLANLQNLKDGVEHAKPDVVFHLAAQASVPDSLANPAETIATNLFGTLNVLEACRARAPSASVLVVGSADAYGVKTPDLMPLREELPLEPRNPYAASKAAAEVVAMQYARSGWLRVIATRSFNHSGPGQSTRFAVASFAKQIADIKAGGRPPQIRVGALAPRRDLTDVRDIVNAYALLAERGNAGNVYNVCSGQDYSMRQVVDELIRLAGVSVEIVEDKALLRSVEIPRLLGDPTRLKRATGWQPAIDFKRTLSDLLEYYAG